MSRLSSQFFCNLNSSKKSTCPSGKLITEFTYKRTIFSKLIRNYILKMMSFLIPLLHFPMGRRVLLPFFFFFHFCSLFSAFGFKYEIIWFFFLCPSVFQLISRRRFQQIDVLEGINVLISISGKDVISLC